VCSQEREKILSSTVFSDFVNITEFGQQYDELIYYPQSQFRWTDLMSDN
jgi:hypothetical protein